MERVVITGMGVVSPLGNNVEKFWRNLTEGKSGISSIDTFDVSNHKAKIAGIIRDFNADDTLGKMKPGVWTAFLNLLWQPLNKLGLIPI